MVNDFSKWVEKTKSELATEEEGPLEEQAKKLKEKSAIAIKEATEQFEKLKEEYKKLEEKEIDEMAEATPDELEVIYNQIPNTVSQTLGTIEQQIISNKKSNVSEEQLREIQTTFRHFDKNNDNQLEKFEFKGACHALGEDIPDKELDSVFEKYDIDKDNKISFDEFVEYMASRAKEGLSYDDLLNAFGELATGKDVITEEQMRQSMPTEDVDYLITKMQKKEDGYDYKAYLDHVFGK
jgi:Ca2+-binding EF-hand superfamily protein